MCYPACARLCKPQALGGGVESVLTSCALHRRDSLRQLQSQPAVAAAISPSPPRRRRRWSDASGGGGSGVHGTLSPRRSPRRDRPGGQRRPSSAQRAQRPSSPRAATRPQSVLSGQPSARRRQRREEEIRRELEAEQRRRGVGDKANGGSPGGSTGDAPPAMGTNHDGVTVLLPLVDAILIHGCHSDPCNDCRRCFAVGVHERLHAHSRVKASHQAALQAAISAAEEEQRQRESATWQLKVRPARHTRHRDQPPRGPWT